MKKIAAIVMIAFSLSIFTGCATTQYDRGTSGRSNIGYCAVMGAAVGGGVGAATRMKKPLANALIGAVIGAFAGATLCAIIENNARQAAIEAAKNNRTVKYRTQQGQRIIATPTSYNETENCKIITNKAWDTDGTFLGEVNRKVCNDGNGNWEEKM